MKKLWLFILAGTFAVSCSDDNYDYKGGSHGAEETILLKRKVITMPGGSTQSVDYRYSNTMLQEVTLSNGTHIFYSYVSGKLTEADYYGDDLRLIRKDVNNYNSSGTLGEHIENFYDNNNPDNSYIIKSTFTYDGNVVTVATYEEDQNGTAQLTGTVVLSIDSGSNIFKAENGESVINYTFDHSNAPRINMDAYYTNVLLEGIGGLNNVSATQVVINGNIISNTYSTFTYNENGYPLTETYTDENGAVTTTQYVY